MKKSKLRCKKNPKNKQFYTSLISKNGKVVFTLGEGFKRKFTEKHRQMLIKTLTEAVIEYVKPKE